jgi:hypothetical protein
VEVVGRRVRELASEKVVREAILELREAEEMRCVGGGGDETEPLEKTVTLPSGLELVVRRVRVV